MNFVSFSDFCDGLCKNQNFITFPFYYNGKPFENGPEWGMTLIGAGSMRFRWNEENEVRQRVLSKIAEGNIIESVELIHSKSVFSAENSGDCKNLKGDGIVTNNLNLMPVVTVADCMPLFIFDVFTGAFGVVHSGWKGTGIIENAILLMKEKYGSKVNNLCVSIGAHIHDCCYIVDETRASYFFENFGKECIRPVLDGEILCKGEAKAVNNWNYGSGKLFRLSLQKANLSILKKIGILEKNIAVFDECTCCNLNFGSNRRETALGKQFTVQACFVRYKKV